jgi:hypothetical protein
MRWHWRVLVCVFILPAYVNGCEFLMLPVAAQVCLLPACLWATWDECGRWYRRYD